MKALSNKQKKFIERNYKKLSREELERRTGLTPQAVKTVIDNCGKASAMRQRHGGHGTQVNARIRFIFILYVLIIFACTLSVYIPALHNDFVWDDITYVVENQWIRNLNVQSLADMFFSFRAGNWHPLTWVSHAVDYRIWGGNPAGHRVINLILHALNAVLVFFLSLVLLARAEALNGKGSLSTGLRRQLAAVITALLFGLHPVHVESVVWVAERKDLLCALFVFSSLLAYLSYTVQASNLQYGLCLFFFIVALMSKPMAVTLPLILLLCDLYPLRRLELSLSPARRQLPVLLEKIPFFIAGGVSAVITMYAQKSGGALKSLELFPLPLRLLNALRSPGFYLVKFLIPVKLVPLYTFPPLHEWLQPGLLINAMLVIAITGFSLWKVRQGKLLLCAAWSYFIVTLLPVLGIIQVGEQAAADRYTYLPSLSIFLMAGIGVAWLSGKMTGIYGRAGAWVPVMVSSCVLLLLAILTMRQTGIWRTSETFWQHVTGAFPYPRSSPVAHNNLGAAYYQQGEWDKAIEEYKRAIALRPRYADAHNNLGVAYARKGLIDDAIAAHREALAISPNLLRAHLNLGASYDKKGELDKAIEEYNKVLALDPRYAAAHTNLAVVYYKQGRYRQAIEHCDRVVELQGHANEELLKLLAPYRDIVP